MDNLATLVISRSDYSYLNALATDLYKLSKKHPETFLVMAKYCEYKKDPDRAFFFVEKALELNPKYVNGWAFKGALLASAGRFSDAVKAFRVGMKWDNDVNMYFGLTQAYVMMDRLKEAMTIAQECLKMTNGNPKAHNMMAMVFTRYPQDHHNVRSIFFTLPMQIPLG